ncbi:MAG: hypothetical protein OXU51_13420 [Candidatus Poribacteria bacterium]|nr:hypothetical protein [Candidatus Poribacteria bacterium]
MTNTLTWNVKQIQLLGIKLNPLAVVSLILICVMVFLSALSIVSAQYDPCLSKHTAYLLALIHKDDCQTDYNRAVQIWKDAPWWKKAYYWTVVVYRHLRLEGAKDDVSRTFQEWADCVNLFGQSGSGNCDSGNS